MQWWWIVFLFIRFVLEYNRRGVVVVILVSISKICIVWKADLLINTFSISPSIAKSVFPINKQNIIVLSLSLRTELLTPIVCITTYSTTYMCSTRNTTMAITERYFCFSRERKLVCHKTSGFPCKHIITSDYGGLWKIIRFELNDLYEWLKCVNSCQWTFYTIFHWANICLVFDQLYVLTFRWIH